MYGENWVYAPAVQKGLALALASRGAILDMRGGECHKGSHSPYSRRWRHTGGGSLLRLGSHPIGAMLYLKRREGLARDGRPIVPVAVTAEVGDPIGSAPTPAERAFVVHGERDVETWGTVLITFSDGSRGNAWGADTMLGGMESRLELCLSNARLLMNLSPCDLVEAYAPEAAVFGDQYIQEKIDSGAGWTTPMPDEDWTSGHQAMCADFVAAAAGGRPALADGRLGLDVVRVVYAAYVAAAEGRRVQFA
jgi:predicted dehydrogenase